VNCEIGTADEVVDGRHVKIHFRDETRRIILPPFDQFNRGLKGEDPRACLGEKDTFDPGLGGIV